MSVLPLSIFTWCDSIESFSYQNPIRSGRMAKREEEIECDSFDLICFDLIFTVPNFYVSYKCSTTLSKVIVFYPTLSINGVAVGLLFLSWLILDYLKFYPKTITFSVYCRTMWHPKWRQMMAVLWGISSNARFVKNLMLNQMFLLYFNWCLSRDAANEQRFLVIETVINIFYHYLFRLWSLPPPRTLWAAENRLKINNLFAVEASAWNVLYFVWNKSFT